MEGVGECIERECCAAGFVEWQRPNFALALHFNADYQRAVLSYLAVTLLGIFFIAPIRPAIIYARDAERHASLLLRYVQDDL